MSRNYKIMILLILVVLILAFVYVLYFLNNNNVQEQNNNIKTEILPLDSGVQGKVIVGPTCPVIKEGDSSCGNKPYSTTIMVIETLSPKSSPFATTKSDKDGKYKVMLPPGEYTLAPVEGQMLPRCQTENVTVVSGKVINMDLLCDSGIR